jgi:hypothetical protein
LRTRAIVALRCGSETERERAGKQWSNLPYESSCGAQMECPLEQNLRSRLIAGIRRGEVNNPTG